MVKQYLQNYEHELLSKRIDIENAIQKNAISIKDTMELLHFVEKSQDKSFDSFSPHSFRTNANDDKLRKLKSRKKELEQYGQDLEEEKNSIDEKIAELENIISLVKGDDNNIVNEIDVISTSQQEINDTTEDFTINFNREYIDNIIHRVNLCKDLLDIDNNRCKLELENISILLNDLIK